MKTLASLNKKQLAILRWTLSILSFLIAAVSLGLMIWGCCILGDLNENPTQGLSEAIINDSNTFHQVLFHSYLTGGMLTGVFLFIFIFTVLVLCMYWSSRKEIILEILHQLKNSTHKEIKNND